MFPSIATPRYTKQSGPKHVLNNVEAMWLYKHAWRGAGLYYRKGDHLTYHESVKDKPASMYKALSMYPVWDKWLTPRCEVVPPQYYANPEYWALSHIDDVKGPAHDVPPLGFIRWEYLLTDKLSSERGNLFRLWCDNLTMDERAFWHAFMQKAEQKIEYRWEDYRKDPHRPIDYPPVKDLDQRFFYYDCSSQASASLYESTERGVEEEKCSDWELEGEDLELGMAPVSYAAKLMQRKRKSDPSTEGGHQTLCGIYRKVPRHGCCTSKNNVSFPVQFYICDVKAPLLGLHDIFDSEIVLPIKPLYHRSHLFIDAWLSTSTTRDINIGFTTSNNMV